FARIRPGDDRLGRTELLVRYFLRPELVLDGCRHSRQDFMDRDLTRIVLDRARLASRIKQYIVDHSEKPLLALLDALQKFPLGFRHRTPDAELEQFGISRDRVERCPELVTHN